MPRTSPTVYVHCHSHTFDAATAHIYEAGKTVHSVVRLGGVDLIAGGLTPLQFALELRRLAGAVEHEYGEFLRAKRATQEVA